MSCVILNSVMNDCYNSKINHSFLFCAGSLLLPIGRFTPDVTEAYLHTPTSDIWSWPQVNLGQFGFLSYCNKYLTSFISRKDTKWILQGVGHCCPLYAFDVFAREFNNFIHWVYKNVKKICDYTIRYRRGDIVFYKRVWFTIFFFLISYFKYFARDFKMWRHMEVVKMTILRKPNIEYTYL